MPPIPVQNARLKEIRRALRSGRATPEGRIAAEGPHLLEEALRSTWTLHEVLCTEAARTRFRELFARVHVPVQQIAARAWDSLASTEHSQGVVALLEPRAWSLSDVLRDPALVVILDAVQDPGNVGTIARSAEAFGASGLILTEGCARLANGKVLRAAAGSLFRLPVLENIAAPDLMAGLRLAPVDLYVLSGSASQPLTEADFRKPSALVVGNEGAGVSAYWQSVGRVTAVPTCRVESLNAAVACSIALFEAARQRHPA